MTDQVPVPTTVRSDLIDVAVEFLRNPKIVSNTVGNKRDFLRKKGLTDSEINYAFQIVPQQDTSVPVVVSHRPSFLRRIFTDLALAGFLSAAFVLVKRWLRSKQGAKKSELIDTLQSLQRTVREMQTSIVKLEQAVDQLHVIMRTSRDPSGAVSSIDEIKNDVQSLKGLLLNRSQFPSVPQFPAQIPAWQLETAEKIKARSSPTANNIVKTTESDGDNKEDGDGIVLISKQDKKSDDENQLSMSVLSSDNSS